MDYHQWTKDDLVKRIEALERLNQQLMDEQREENTLSFSWSGNLGHWYWDYPTNHVTFNPLKITALGYDVNEIEQPVTYQFFTSKIHPEDYQRVMDGMIKHLKGEAHVYEAEYRIKGKDGEYRWFYDRGSVTKRDDQGKPLFLAGIVFNITERKKEEQTLMETAVTDELTKVMNRRGILALLNDHLSEQTHQPALSILMLDIDDFKHINDTYGHLVGDAVLLELANLIQDNLRKTDYLGRYGGEEFLVVFPNSHLNQIKTVSERIRKAVESHVFPNHIHLTISGGAYELRGGSLYDVIHQADLNLYEAKRIGKNRIVY